MMKKFQKKTFGSKNKEEKKDDGSLKSASPMPHVFAERYLEELEPTEKKEFVTYKQESYIWDGKKWMVIGIRYGDVSSRNITRDIRKMAEENKPLKKVKHDPEDDKK